jgi:hypothetical protein
MLLLINIIFFDILCLLTVVLFDILMNHMREKSVNSTLWNLLQKNFDKREDIPLL